MDTDLFQELVKDAPNFASMNRGELVAYAYAMYAAGTMKDAENDRLLKLVQRMWPAFIGKKRFTFADRLYVMAEFDELGIEVN